MADRLFDKNSQMTAKSTKCKMPRNAPMSAVVGGGEVSIPKAFALRMHGNNAHLSARADPEPMQ